MLYFFSLRAMPSSHQSRPRFPPSPPLHPAPSLCSLCSSSAGRYIHPSYRLGHMLKTLKDAGKKLFSEFTPGHPPTHCATHVSPSVHVEALVMFSWLPVHSYPPTNSPHSRDLMTWSICSVCKDVFFFKDGRPVGQLRCLF